MTEHHGQIDAKAVVLTAGTSLRGRIWIGKECQESGGDGRPAVNLLSECLAKLGFSLIRLKTGTPPRLKASSCNFAACQRQDGENPRPLFHVEHSAESLLTQRREDAEDAEVVGSNVGKAVEDELFHVEHSPKQSLRTPRLSALAPLGLVASLWVATTHKGRLRASALIKILQNVPRGTMAVDSLHLGADRRQSCNLMP